MPQRTPGGFLVVAKAFFGGAQNLALQTAQDLPSITQHMARLFLGPAD
ncbi:MAG: hypothetical protein V4627_10170 [Pseudomonadota bacterium]